MALNINPSYQPKSAASNLSALGSSAPPPLAEDPIALARLQFGSDRPPWRLSAHLGLGGLDSQLDQKSQGHPTHRSWGQAPGSPPFGPPSSVGLGKFTQCKQHPHLVTVGQDLQDATTQIVYTFTRGTIFDDYSTSSIALDGCLKGGLCLPFLSLCAVF